MSEPRPSEESLRVPEVARDWPAVGEVNMLEAFIGARGHGKSTYQCVRAYEASREWGSAYVIGHSFGQRLPEKLPDVYYRGPRLPIVYHPSLDKLNRGLHKDPSKWHILAPPSGAEARAAGVDMHARDTADDLLQYAEDLSLAIRKQAWWRANPWRLYMPRSVRFLGLQAPPVIVLIDEGVAVAAAKGGADKRADTRHDWFQEYLFSLRHNHIALFYAIQNPSSRSWKLLEQATALHCFKLQHEWALNEIRAAGGATPEEIAEIGALRHFDHVTLRR